MANAALELTVEPRVSARGRAVKYAEELGLNATHQEASAAVEALGILYHQRAQEESGIRHLKAAVEGRTAIVMAETASETFSSQAALDRATKLALANDAELRDLSSKLRDAQDKAGAIEAEIRSNESALRVNTARMNQLGGYFAYLAASKEALTAERILGQIP